MYVKGKDTQSFSLVWLPKVRIKTKISTTRVDVFYICVSPSRAYQLDWLLKVRIRTAFRFHVFYMGLTGVNFTIIWSLFFKIPKFNDRYMPNYSRKSPLDRNRADGAVSVTVGALPATYLPHQPHSERNFVETVRITDQYCNWEGL
jgi:hypothetical protein